MSIFLRRSARLNEKIPFYYYMSQYNKILYKIKNKLINIVNNMDYISREKTVYGLYDIIKIINDNFSFLINYGNDDKNLLNIIKRLYKKSFDWMKEAFDWIEEEKSHGSVIEKTDYTERLIKQIKKFRNYYEIIRNEYYEDIIIKFNVDKNIIYNIDSYL
jgi:hypothetical protein